MKRLYPIIFLVLLTILTVGCATVSTSGNYTLQSGKTLRGNLLVTSGNATLEESSRVTGDVVLTSGNLEANGEVDGNIMVTSGNVSLGPEALVKGDITTTSGNISRAEGSEVRGQILSNQSFTIGGGFFARLFGLFCLLPLLLIGGLFVLLVVLLRRKPTAVTEKPAVNETANMKLKQLKQMLDDGLITEAEYEAKKAEILSAM